MKNIKFWVVLFAFTGIITSYLFSCFLWDLYCFNRLSNRTNAESIDWKIVGIKNYKYIVKANYEFKLNDEVYKKEQCFFNKKFPNYHSAKGYMNKLKTFENQVWYNPKNLKICSLEKKFPFKSTANFVLSLTVLLYFFWLRLYIKKVCA